MSERAAAPETCCSRLLSPLPGAKSVRSVVGTYRRVKRVVEGDLELQVALRPHDAEVGIDNVVTLVRRSDLEDDRVFARVLYRDK